MADTPPKKRDAVTVGEAFDVMVEASGVVKTNAQYLARVTKPIVYVVVSLIAIVVVLQVQLAFRDDRIEKLEETIVTLDQNVVSLQNSSESTASSANDAKIAAEAAKTALEEALAQSQRGGVSPEVVQALQRINDIYEACRARGECQ